MISARLQTALVGMVVLFPFLSSAADYEWWPAHKKGTLLPWAKDDDSYWLSLNQFFISSEMPLGTEPDVQYIKEAILTHMKNPKVICTRNSVGFFDYGCRKLWLV